MQNAHFFDELRSSLDGEILLDDVSRALYSTDASIYQVMPMAVVVPRSVEDVRELVGAAARHGVSVVPRGGGSSLAGQTVGEGVVIDFSKYLDEVLEVNVEERWARVQPGLVLEALNRRLSEHGLMVGPDPASGNRATLGGMLANNSTGTHSILYGNFIDHVRRASVILADGTATSFEALDVPAWTDRRTRPGLEGDVYRKVDKLLAENAKVIRDKTPVHWRRNSGYRLEALLSEEVNLARVLCGSEGTLAVVTDLEIGLVEKPAHTGLAAVHFHKRLHALRAVTSILRTEPAAIELLDGTAIKQGRKAPGFADSMAFIEGDPGGVLLVEYYGRTAAEAAEALEQLAQRAQALHGFYHIFSITDPAYIARVWAVRREVLGLVMGIRGEYKPVPFIEDAAVPVEHLADYIEKLDTYISGTGTRTAYYAHASAGCLHVRPFLNLKEANEVEKMKDIAMASMELVRGYGGSVSSEHGDGLARSWLNPYFLDEELYKLNVSLKQIFDPAGILNPGKVVEAPPMTESLRFGPEYRTARFQETMDFGDFGGFAEAVEMCNGNGACRKLDTGTMCPSFMVTRNEQDSTRGRANALRLAMAGHLSPGAMTDRRMYEVMDLCIQCKACKTECPSNVDMARIKTEWLSRYWADNKVPMRTKLFAHLPAIARAAGKTGRRIGSVVNGSRLTRGIMSTLLGVARERQLPRFASKTFVQWFGERGEVAGEREIVLFPDSFTNFFEPDVGRAAVEVLEAAGYHVLVPELPVCCGRTYLSKGFLAQAQRTAIETIDVLFEYADRGLDIIGLEPSCILTLRDEFLVLLAGEKRARTVAKKVATFDEFVLRNRRLSFSNTRFHTSHDPVLVHGHCHQKALSGTDPTIGCLELCGYEDVQVVDSGCCGMAGAFGYEKEHLSISHAMAERRLAPAVRALPENGVVVAAGTSCRAQILDLTGKVALHPAQAARNQLAAGQSRTTH
ncbi:MAG: FAD-binding protein [Rhodothermia bacterium]|nr:FAD-binding protein [Rhodothermia bacterium]